MGRRRRRLDLLNTRPVFDAKPKCTAELSYEPKKDMAELALASAHSFSCLRSNVERFPDGRGKVGVRDGLARDRVYDTDRVSILYKQNDRTRHVGKHAGSLSSGRSFPELQRHLKAERQRERRQRRQTSSRTLDHMHDRLYDTNCGRNKSMVDAVEQDVGNPATSMQSKIKRWVTPPTPYVRNLGPGSFDTSKPPKTAGARLEFSTVKLERGADATPAAMAKLGPGFYDPQPLERHKPALPISQVPRFKTRVEFFRTNQSTYNHQRDAKHWQRGGHFSQAARKPMFADASGVATDFMPELDSGSKVSLATGVTRSPITYAHSFASKTQRGDLVGVGTSEALGPGTFNPSAERQGIRVRSPTKPSPAFAQRSGARVDPRVMSDNFQSMRPRFEMAKSRLKDMTESR